MAMAKKSKQKSLEVDICSDKRKTRLERKKKKLKAFLAVAKLNDEDKKKIKKMKKLDSSDSESASESQNGSASEGLITIENNNETKKKMTKLELVTLRQQIKDRARMSMTRCKVFCTLDRIQLPCDVVPGIPRSTNKESSTESCGWTDFQLGVEHPLFATDLQHLVLYGLLGETWSYRPRWCTLLRPSKVAKVVVLEMVGVTKGMFLEHQDSLGRLKDMGFTTCVEMISPSQYQRSYVEEVTKICLSRTQSEGYQEFKKRAKKREAAEQRARDRSNRVKSKVAADKREESSSVEAQSGHDEGCDRLSLVLTMPQLISERIPLPVELKKYPDFVFTCRKYKPVTNSSPMFAVDCEMCITTARTSELTRVAIIDEQLNTVYETLVKPRNRITQYLTKYSGITKKMLDRVTTRIEHVQRRIQRILPKDAILCGQSLGGDLRALKMFHPYIIDTSVIYNLHGDPRMKTGLKRLTETFLHRSIQNSAHGHNPIEDAAATMDLVNLKLREGLTFGNLCLPDGHMQRRTSGDTTPTATEPHEEQEASDDREATPSPSEASEDTETSPSPAEPSKKRKASEDMDASPERPEKRKSSGDTDDTLTLAKPSKKWKSSDAKADEESDDERQNPETTPTEGSTESIKDYLPEVITAKLYDKEVFFQQPGTSETTSLFHRAETEKKKVTMVGRESMLAEMYAKNGNATDSHIATSTNEACYKQCQRLVKEPERSLVWGQFQLVSGEEPTEDNIETRLEEMQKIAYKVHKKCSPSTIFVVLLAGDDKTELESNSVCLVKVT